MKTTFLNLNAKDTAGNDLFLGTKDKYDEAIRHIEESLDIEEMNRYINVCDSIKDALEDPPIAISDRKFKNVLLSLYGVDILSDPKFRGRGIAWEAVLNTIKDNIKKNPEYGDVKPVKLCFLRHLTATEIEDKIARRPHKYPEEGDLEHPLEILPLHVKYAIQESGFAPTVYNYAIQTIITPASYIDPASRAKLADPATLGYSGAIIPQEVFKVLGFEKAIVSFEGVIQDDKSLQAEIVRPKTTYTIERTADYGHKGTQPDYFVGNTLKNTWFNGLNEESAQMYILCKELGDTLQVIYAKLIMGKDTNIALCVFTGDQTVVARCRELGVPVCYQGIDPSDKKHSYYNLAKALYYPHTALSEGALFESLKSLYCTVSIRSNNAVIASIKKFVRERRFNLAARVFFNEIIKSIEDANHALTSLLDSNDPIDAIKKQCLEYQALPIIQEKTEFQDTQIVSNTTRLFIKGNIRDILYEKISTMKPAIGEDPRAMKEKTLYSFINTLSLKRGSLEEALPRGSSPEYIAAAKEVVEQDLAREAAEDAAAKDPRAIAAAREERERKAAEKEARAAEKAVAIKAAARAARAARAAANVGMNNKQYRTGQTRKRRRNNNSNQAGGFDDSSEEFTITYFKLVSSIVSEILKATKDDEISNEIFNISYGFTCLTYMYFNFIGVSCLNRDVLFHFILFYMGGYDINLSEFTLDDFEKEYNSLRPVQEESNILSSAELKNTISAQLNLRSKVNNTRTQKLKGFHTEINNLEDPIPPVKYVYGGTRKKGKLRRATCKNKNKIPY